MLSHKSYPSLKSRKFHDFALQLYSNNANATVSYEFIGLQHRITKQLKCAK